MNRNIFLGTAAALMGIMLILASLVGSARAESYAWGAHNGSLCPDSRGRMQPCFWAGNGSGYRGGGYDYRRHGGYQPRYIPQPPRIYRAPRLLGHNVCDPYGRCVFVPAY